MHPKVRNSSSYVAKAWHKKGKNQPPGISCWKMIPVSSQKNCLFLLPTSLCSGKKGKKPDASLWLFFKGLSLCLIATILFFKSSLLILKMYAASI